MKRETLEEKRAFVAEQTRQAEDEIRPFVRCRCLRKLWMPHAYKCLYCGEWYCKECAALELADSD